MSLSPVIEQLVDALTLLPGVGRKNAQRMALFLIDKRPNGGHKLAQAITDALAQIGRCQRCRNLTEHELCPSCSDLKRDKTKLCIVETPMDVVALEASGSYRGTFFVLYGRLSPLDGVGPDQLGFDQLADLVRDEPIEEIILATNPTVEGEATAHYLQQMLDSEQIVFSRIAQGVPTGGELEYVDGNTLSLAIAGRQPYKANY